MVLQGFLSCVHSCTRKRGLHFFASDTKLWRGLVCSSTVVYLSPNQSDCHLHYKLLWWLSHLQHVLVHRSNPDLRSGCLLQSHVFWAKKAKRWAGSTTTTTEQKLICGGDSHSFCFIFCLFCGYESGFICHSLYAWQLQLDWAFLVLSPFIQVERGEKM